MSKKIFGLILTFIMSIAMLAAVPQNATRVNAGEEYEYSSIMIFSYNNSQYVIPGDSTVPLSELLIHLGITGEVTDVELKSVNNYPVTYAAIKVEQRSDGWFVTSLDGVPGEWEMRVTIDGQVYSITEYMCGGCDGGPGHVFKCETRTRYFDDDAIYVYCEHEGCVLHDRGLYMTLYLPNELDGDSAGGDGFNAFFDGYQTIEMLNAIGGDFVVTESYDQEPDVSEIQYAKAKFSDTPGIEIKNVVNGYYYYKNYTYYSVEEVVSQLSQAPFTCGSYQASVTVKGATASVGYRLGHAYFRYEIVPLNDPKPNAIKEVCDTCGDAHKLTIIKPNKTEYGDDESPDASFEEGEDKKYFNPLPYITYKEKESGNVIEAPIHPGTYTAEFTLGIGDKARTAFVEYTIAPRTVTVSGITAKDKVYDGKADAQPDLSRATINGVLDADKGKLTIDSAAGAFADANVGENKTVTISNVVLDGECKGDYQVADFTVTASILPATLTDVSVKQTGTLVFNGTAQRAEVSASATAVNDQPVTFLYSAEENGTYAEEVPAFTEAGQHTVYYKASAPNHNDAKGSFTVEIRQKTYALTSGAGGKWKNGSTDTLEFVVKASDDDEHTIDHFKGIQVDGKDVPEKDDGGKANWTAKKGSVVIDLQPDYLKTLSAGEHTLTVLLKDAEPIETTFTIEADTSPKTGDNNHVILWAVLMAASLAGGISILVLARRKLKNK